MHVQVTFWTAFSYLTNYERSLGFPEHLKIVSSLSLRFRPNTVVYALLLEPWKCSSPQHVAESKKWLRIKRIEYVMSKPSGHDWCTVMWHFCATTSTSAGDECNLSGCSVLSSSSSSCWFWDCCLDDAGSVLGTRLWCASNIIRFLFRKSSSQ